MKKATIAVRPYRHSKRHKFIVDLRAFGKGEFHSREAVCLSQREMSDFISAKKKPGEYGETINDAVKHRVDYLERVRRHGITVAQLADEVVEAKCKDGRSEVYLRDLRYRLSKFVQDFEHRPIAGITVDELDNWLRGGC